MTHAHSKHSTLKGDPAAPWGQPPEASFDPVHRDPFAHQPTVNAFFETSEPSPATDESAYRMYRGGPSVAPDEVELPDEQVVEVTIRWGHNVLSTRHLAADAGFTLGDGSGSGDVDFTVPAEKVGGGRLPLVKRTAGATLLLIPADATGTVTREEQPGVSLESIRGSARPSTVLPGAVEWPLPLDTQVELWLGDLCFVVRFTNAGKPVPRGLGSGFDWDVAAYFGASVLSVGALLTAAAFFMPPMGLTSGEATLDEQRRLIMPYLESLAEKEREPEESIQHADDRSEGGTGQRAVGEEGQMGKQEAVQRNRRHAVAGNPENPDPHLARERALQEAVSFGIIGLVTGDPNAPTAPWGRDTSLGLDDVSAMGNLWGDELGEAQGVGGLALSGSGDGAGGLGFGIGLGAIGTLGTGDGRGPGQGFGDGHGRVQGGHRTRAFVMRPDGVTVSGRLPPQVIQRIVRQNFGRLRLCYEKGLTKNPNLEGRVSVRFVIDRNGGVSSAANGGSSLPSADVASCVVSAFYGLSFPKPEGGIVTVSYPIAFSPG